jgi:hypothetical protein
MTCPSHRTTFDLYGAHQIATFEVHEFSNIPLPTISLREVIFYSKVVRSA